MDMVLALKEFDSPLCKRFRMDFDDSQLPSTSSVRDNYDSDKESVYSWQSDETAWVVDSGEDWTPSESELEPSEFEMASETSEESKHCTQSSSSDVSVMVLEPPVPLVYDESESSITKETESEDIVPHQRPAIWKCLKCGVETSAPMKFCTTCYKKRKWNLPPRPRKRGKLDKKAVGDLAVDSSQRSEAVTSSDDMCSMCEIRQRNGGFLHTNTIHAIYCYSCTKDVLSRGNKCPICRRTIQRAVRIFNS